MSFCTDLSLLKDFGGYKTISSLKCRRWACPECGPRRARELRWRARNARPTIFLTLTIRKGFAASPAAQAVELAKGWRMLRQFLCRLYGWKSIPFIAVIERHKSGWPHIHILMRCKYIPHQTIREWWVGRFQSHKIWIEAVEQAGKAAKYVSKYLAKAPEAFEGCKRYWASHDWDLQKPEKFVSADADTCLRTVLRGNPNKLVNLAVIDGASATWDGKTWTVYKWWNSDVHRWFE